MRPYSELSNKGRTVNRDDIYHATYDGGEGNRREKAKAQRKAARRQAKKTIHNITRAL